MINGTSIAEHARSSQTEIIRIVTNRQIQMCKLIRSADVQTHVRLNLKLNCHVDMPGGCSPWASMKVRPSWMILRRSTLQRSNWYWYSAVLRNSPIGLATTPGNSVSCERPNCRINNLKQISHFQSQCSTVLYSKASAWVPLSDACR